MRSKRTTCKHFYHKITFFYIQIKHRNKINLFFYTVIKCNDLLKGNVVETLKFNVVREYVCFYIIH